MVYQPILDFIKTLYPDKPVIALHEPSFFGNEKKYVLECIDSTFVSSVGPFVGRFEQIVADFVSQRRDPRLRGDDNATEVRAVACVNGTAALHLALVVAGVKAGDEVITQPLSFIATANPIVYIGASPVFVDVDPDTLGLSPKALRHFLETQTHAEPGSAKRLNNSTNKQIKACVPMHTFGNPCRIDEIVEICNEFNIIVIEDAAESIGSYYKGRHTGTFGQMGVLSFNGNKTITTGGGGMVITDNRQLATFLKHLSTQAKVPHPCEFAHDAIGYNYRLPNINAALGVAQMENLDLILKSKRLVAQKYFDFFAEKGIRTIKEISHARSNFWLNGIFLADKTQRDEFLQLANSQGVHCRPAWNLLPTLPMYRNFQCEDITNAQRISDTLVNVPSSPIGQLQAFV
ncbi:MAG: LegC family aminotransferase [Bacteroidales bacterium]